ncbi:hypothetical protein [Chitinophaga niabensis]|uniref:Trypsin-like peptidase domain-containing protein n=1 Tax=Chitinophaga niabensis TaxID=536979 RepID=A0A1N6ERI1_9BACT|nr:hypothetical protein [Chitinophaga niabensis]SIN85646.1 hypothetical protein SAMN04488055_1782 [Chitinophaga niabensis]
MNDEKIESLKSITKHFSEIILTATCELFIYKKNTKILIPWGSGLLLRHNGNHYLLSCAHVLCDLKGEIGPFFLMNGEVSTIGGKICQTNPHFWGNRKQDHYDIAVIKLNDSTIDFIQRKYMFFEMGHIKTGHIKTENSLCMCIGYPSSYTKKEIISSSVFISNPGYSLVTRLSKSDINIPGYNEDHHFAVNYSIGKVSSFTNTGKKKRGPNPYGMSGGGLWLVESQDKSDLHTARLIGINREYIANKSLLISTRIDFFIDIIRQNFDPTIENNGIQVNLV